MTLNEALQRREFSASDPRRLRDFKQHCRIQLTESFNFGTAGGRNAHSSKCIKAIVWIEGSRRGEEGEKEKGSTEGCGAVCNSWLNNLKRRSEGTVFCGFSKCI